MKEWKDVEVMLSDIKIYLVLRVTDLIQSMSSMPRTVNDDSLSISSTSTVVFDFKGGDISKIRGIPAHIMISQLQQV